MGVAKRSSKGKSYYFGISIQNPEGIDIISNQLKVEDHTRIGPWKVNNHNQELRSIDF